MTDTKSFDERFDATRHTQPLLAVERFTREEVAHYVEAKAQSATDFGYPYKDVLRLFPRDWWLPAIEKVLCERPDTGGARAFVKALFEVDPAYFAEAPYELLGWNIGFARTMRMLQARPAAACAGLRRMFAVTEDARRWEAAAHLALLEPPKEAALHAELAALGDPDPVTNRAALLARWKVSAFGYELRDGELRRYWPRALHHLAFPAGYFGPRARPAHEAPPGEAWLTALAFGGTIEGRNEHGGPVRLAHLVTLDPPPAGLGVTSSRLVLAVSRAMLEGDGSARFYRHRPDGGIECNDEDMGDHPALRAARVRLVRSSSAIAFQAWAEGGGREPLPPRRISGLRPVTELSGMPRLRPGDDASALARFGPSARRDAPRRRGARMGLRRRREWLLV